MIVISCHPLSPQRPREEALQNKSNYLNIICLGLMMHKQQKSLMFSEQPQLLVLSLTKIKTFRAGLQESTAREGRILLGILQDIPQTMKSNKIKKIT